MEEGENVVFYRCKICGNVIGLIQGDAKHMTCCGKELEPLIANTEDASFEKHLPVYEKVGDEIIVKVGEVEHPMEPEHYIEWIILETKDMEYKKKLNPGEKPFAAFILNDGDEAVAAYEYCNLHRLWKKDL